MKKLIIALVVVLLLVAAFFGWRLMRGHNDVAASIPQDITMVARIDFPSLAVHYGLNGRDAGRFMRKLLWYSDDDIDGIDYLSPSYAFASQGYFGAVVPLNDSKRFKQFVEQARSCRFEQQRGLSWAVVDFNVLLAVSDDRAMMMGPAVDAEQDALRNVIAACLKQDEKESGMQTELFQMMSQREEPIVLATTYAALPEQARIETLDKEFDLDALCATAGVTLYKDKATVALSLSSNDKRINKFLDKMNEALQPTNGRLLANAPTGPSMFIEAGIKGEALLKALRSIPSVRTKLLLANALMDVDMMVRSIDGDVAFSVTDDDALTQIELNDTRVLDNVSGWNDEVTRAAGLHFEDRGGHSGSVRYKGHQFYYRADDKRLMISRNDQLVAATAHHDVKYEWASTMDGQRFFASIDVSQSLLSAYLKQVERLTVTSQDIRQWNIELKTNLNF